MDGIRAIAVAAVVVFHFDPTVLPGGFLGVDAFFVVSGFLITRLVLGEIQSSGRLGLLGFYRRRARRLMPALVPLALAVSAASVMRWHDQLATLRAGLLSSAGYATNWWLILDKQSYFVTSGRPPMLQHLWSLAIEEQYYLIWPAVLILITLTRRERPESSRLRWVAVVAAVGSVASTVTMAALAIAGDVPYATDSARVYYGTDTHSMGLLLGSAAGALSLLPAVQARLSAPELPRRTWDVAAVGALLLIGWQFRSVTEFYPQLYRGGLLAFDAAVVTVIAALLVPSVGIARVLDSRILTWVGRRSYSIYLWHWPVAVVTRPGVDVHGPALAVNAMRMVLTLALADLSYRLVERRFRYPRPAQAAQAAQTAPTAQTAQTAQTAHTVQTAQTAQAAPTARRLRVGWRTASAALAALACVTGLASVHLPLRNAPRNLPVAAGLDPSVGLPADPNTAVGVASSSDSPPHRVSPALGAGAIPRVKAEPAGPSPISAFGDSVLLGAAPAITRLDPAAGVYAVEGRSAYDVLNDVRAALRHHVLAPIVVIHTGNNGIIDPQQLASTLAALAGSYRVVLVTDRVARDWEAPNNQTIRAIAGRYAGVVALDWHAISSSHPDWFYDDGLHLDASGAAAYARLVLDATRRARQALITAG